MDHVITADRPRIADDRAGAGPAVILVGGAPDGRPENQVVHPAAERVV